MLDPAHRALTFTEADLDFVISETAPDAKNKAHLKQLVQEDDDFRQALVGDNRVFQRAMADEEVFLNISPGLYFEILLRRALNELEVATHTVEWVGKQSIPVFDTVEVVDILARSEVLNYLAQMLASFTRIHSYIISVRVRKGIRRRIRYNDMDIDSLLRLSSSADEEERFGFYKRIADVCLFISGIFSAYAPSSYSSEASGQDNLRRIRHMRRSMEDYEEEGRRFYSLVEDHPTAQTLNLSEVFGLLSKNFTAARKPLSFIATHYLHSRNHNLFGVPT